MTTNNNENNDFYDDNTYSNEISDSGQRDDHEILVKKRKENDFVAYCPQLNRLVKGDSFENVYYSIEWAIFEHIKSINPDADFDEQISTSDIFSLGLIDNKIESEATVTTNKSNELEQIELPTVIPENIVTVTENSDDLLNENDENFDEEKVFSELVKEEKSLEETEDSDEHFEEMNEEEINEKIEEENIVIVAKEIVEEEKAEAESKFAKKEVFSGKNFVRKKMDEFRQYSEHS
jgi:hypothetical protein